MDNLILSDVVKIVSDISEETDISEESEIRELLDSFNQLMMISNVETRFKITIPIYRAEALITINDLVDLIKDLSRSLEDKYGG